MRIKKLLSHSAAVGVGVAIGTFITKDRSDSSVSLYEDPSLYTDEEDDNLDRDDKRFSLLFNQERAKIELDQVQLWLDMDWTDYNTGAFVNEQRNIRDNYSYFDEELTDYHNELMKQLTNADDKERVKVPVNEKQRLLRYECYVYGPPVQSTD